MYLVSKSISFSSQIKYPEDLTFFPALSEKNNICDQSTVAPLFVQVSLSSPIFLSVLFSGDSYRHYPGQIPLWSYILRYLVAAQHQETDTDED